MQEVIADDEAMIKITTIDDIPQVHKVTVVDILAGGKVIHYGMVIKPLMQLSKVKSLPI